jgi:hypothetical protein
MGRDLAGFCARSLATGMKMSERNRGKVVLSATRGDNSFDIGIVYARLRRCVKQQRSAYSPRIPKDTTWVFWAILFALFAAATALLAKVGVSGSCDPRVCPRITKPVRRAFDGAVRVIMEIVL